MSTSLSKRTRTRSTFSSPNKGSPSKKAHSGGDSTASIPDIVFNVVKNLIGCGVLALPSGVAEFAKTPLALVPASFYVVLMAAIFGYYFFLIAKVCQMTGSVSFRQAWNETMGQKSAKWAALCTLLKPGITNLSYSMILADTFRALFVTMGLGWSRTFSLLIITVAALLPLCLIKNLKLLAPFSMVGTMAFFLVGIVMGIRYWDGTYRPGGIYYKDLEPQYAPSFDMQEGGGLWSVKVLVLICMLEEAYMCHYNAPRFYRDLRGHTLSRFSTVVLWSFGSSALLYILIMGFGFLTFGGNCDGYILNNYSTSDPLATVCRVAIAIAILCTYPVVFMGYRDGVVMLLHIPETSRNLNVLTAILLAIVTVIAALIDDLSLINALQGGTLATAIVFCFPTLMYRKVLSGVHKDEETGLATGPTRAQKRELRFAVVLMWVGIAMGIIGVCIALADKENEARN